MISFSTQDHSRPFEDMDSTYLRTPTRRVEDSPSIIQDLQDNGYSVVGGVLDESECSRFTDMTWEWLSSLGSGIDRHDPLTWTSSKWPKGTHGLIQHYNVGHSPFSWGVRMNTNVRKVFGDLWGTDDLVTSFDGVCIKRPPEITRCRFESSADKSWLHCDQSKGTVNKVPTVNGWQCIQGAVNLEDSDIGDGCFHVLSGSHRFHSSASWEGTNKDWYKLSETDIKWYESKGCVSTKVTCPKGGMVLWDSRSIHASSNPVKGRAHPGRFRYTVFVCMTPRRHVSSIVQKRRKKAFDEGRTTSHWPSRTCLFGKTPRTYGNKDDCVGPEVKRSKTWESLV